MAVVGDAADYGRLSHDALDSHVPCGDTPAIVVFDLYAPQDRDLAHRVDAASLVSHDLAVRDQKGVALHLHRPRHLDAVPLVAQNPCANEDDFFPEYLSACVEDA